MQRDKWLAKAHCYIPEDWKAPDRHLLGALDEEKRIGPG